MSAAPQPDPDEAGTTDVLPTTLALLDARVEADPRHLDLAKDVDGSVLSFLALHGGPATRRAVAAHSGTPSDVNLRLAKDPDEEVRSELARKISWRLSALDDSVPNSVREATFRILERLARDRSSEVRAALSREIRFLCNLPRHIAHAFARDPDAAISGPILECSPLLSEADLMEIILADESREALAFIARRRPLGADLCDAIIFFLDPAAVAALLANPDANIRKQALEHIAEHAESVASCLDPLVQRHDLSPRAVRRIASIAGRRVIEHLVSSKTHDTTTQTILDRALQARLDESARRSHSGGAKNATELVETAKDAGTLSDAFVRQAVDAGEFDLVVAALVELAGTPGRIVRRILLSGSSKSVTSLARRAGLSMRTAYRILGLVTNLPSQRPRERAPNARRRVLPWRFATDGRQAGGAERPT